MALTEAQKAAKAKASAAARKAAKNTTTATDTAAPAAAVAAPTIDKSKKIAGAAQSTVFVASKIERGIYLQLFAPVTQQRRLLGGGMDKEVVQMRQPQQYRIKPTLLGPGLIPNYPIIDGFSITKDIPSQFWREWVEQNKQFEPYTMGLIRAFDTEADAMAYAREYAGLRTGREALAQDRDPRIQTSNNANVSDVEIDSETPRPKTAA